MQSLRNRFASFKLCPWWRANVALVLLSAIAVSAMLRQIAWIALFALPADTFAQELAARAIQMSAPHFGFACFFAGWGGVSSLLHEIKTDASKFSFMNAVGHMFIAQFAGVLMYLIALEYEYSIPSSLFACGIAGWFGNKFIVALSDLVTKRLGIGEIR